MNDNKKSFRIRGVKSPERIGIVAGNLKEMITKGCKTLKIPFDDGVQLCEEDDGTLIIDDEYFQTLNPGKCLVLRREGETWNGGIDMIKGWIEQTLLMVQEPNLEQHINDFLSESPSETHRLLVEFVNSIEGNINAERRNEDLNWFEGMAPRFDTKSQVMFVKAQERVRCYFSKMKETLVKVKDNFPIASLVHYKMVLQEIKDSLKEDEYNGIFFKRSSCHADRMCDVDGWFRCEGEYNQDCCNHNHLINPYSTKDNLILFSSWNLDHVMDKKQRTVLPALVDAIHNCPRNMQVNSTYFYNLLFTRMNLKLVDIRCHNKGVHHGRVVDYSNIYRNPRN